MQTARLGEGLVVDASHADTKGDREGGLLGAEGHLVEDHGAEVALVLGGAAEVEELALRTPSTQGTVGRSVRLGVWGCSGRGMGVGVVNVWKSAAIEAAEARAAALLFYLRCGEGGSRGFRGGPAGRSTSWPRPRAATTWRRWRGGTGRRARRGC